MNENSKPKQTASSTDLKTLKLDSTSSELSSKEPVPTPVNHPNFIPDQKVAKDSSTADHGDVKGKPPIGSNGSSDTSGKSKVQYSRSESHDQKTRGSVVSFGSCDSKTNEEEVVITYQDEAIDIDEVGTGIVSTTQKTPVRLVIISSKMRNTSAIRQNLQPNVVLIQYKYDHSTLDQILGLVARSLGQQRCETAALIFSCSGLSIQLCNKDGKAHLLTKETITESQLVQDFFNTLVNTHMVKTGGARLDFLGCNLLLHSDGGTIDKEIEALVGIPVKFYKDLGGGEFIKTLTDEGTVKSSCCVGEMYFKLEKLRGWINQQQQTLAGFEKIQTVGKGAYGAAVLYKKKDDESLVILKEINMHDLNASERQMALNEVNILAMLEHPNIISYYDSFEEDGVIMIEMEYADGGTLAQYLSSQDKSQEERQILIMFQQILAAIRHVHEHNILHRDLKTANIFLTKEGVVKVGDFGISKMMSTANKGANTVLGTPYYISPEMCEGKPYNHKSDIWALGCILYEMACLQKTFEGSNLPALVNKIMKGQFAPVKDTYSQGFKDLIMLMLSQNPDLRPSANDLLYSHIPKLLEQCEENLSDNEDDTTVRTNSENSKKRSRTVLYYFDSATVEITPIELNSRLKIRSTAVGADHVIVVTMESQVFTWGEGSKGQLGHGDTESVVKPKQVEALRGKSIARACCGDGFSLFASDRGIVLTCGDGSAGCLGHADWSSVSRPRLIESLLSVDVVSVACGTRHVSVVGSEGEVFTWGDGKDGKLGLGDEENHCQPVRMGISEPVLISDVFCGVDGTMFITDVGSVFACGSNAENKLGLNNRHGFIAAMRNIFTRCEVEGQKVPTSVRALARHKVLDISMGCHHTAVIVEPGHVYTFGRNAEGQLGIEGIKPANAPVEVKSMSEKHIVRVRCGDHYTVASTDQNEIYYWGLRFRDQGSPNPETNTASRESLNKDDMRVESVTPRNATHSRQASSASGISLNSLRENEDTSPPNKDGESSGSPQRQVSLDSNVSLTDSGYTGDASTSTEITSRTGFRPLSNVPRRSTSANSRENTKEKEKEADANKDTSQIIYPPDHLMKIIPGEEMLTLTSFYCHGENIFIQVDTTAPPPRRKSRKKRGIRKRFSGSTLTVPASSEKGTSASSREGGDEYSSEASEMDTQGTVPAWLREELAVSENDVNDGNLADDTSGQSEEEKGRVSIESSMSSIQINRDLTPYKVAPDNNITPRNNFTTMAVSTTTKKISPRDVRVRSFSNSTESEVSNQSDGSTKDLKIASSECPTRTTLLRPATTKVTSSKGRGGNTGARAKSAVNSGSQWSHNRLRRGYTGNDMALKEQLSARGFVSDVTVKRREEALLGELRMTRDEKLQAEQRLKELEDVHRQEQERLRQEAEQKAIERERSLQEQIQLLRQELQTQNSQLKNNEKMVSSLQEQLGKVHKKKKTGGVGGGGGGTSESKVCSLQ